MDENITWNVEDFRSYIIRLGWRPWAVASIQLLADILTIHVILTQSGLKYFVILSILELLTFYDYYIG